MFQVTITRTTTNTLSTLLLSPANVWYEAYLCCASHCYNRLSRQMQDYELRNDSLLASPNFVKLYSEYVRCKMKRDMRLNVVQTTIGMDR